MNYEYKTYFADGPPSGEQLNELAKDGWRFVAILSLQGTEYYPESKYVIYFEYFKLDYNVKVE